MIWTATEGLLPVTPAANRLAPNSWIARHRMLVGAWSGLIGAMAFTTIMALTMLFRDAI